MNTRKHLLFIAVAGAFATFPPQAGAAEVGRVLMAAGETVAMRDGREIRLDFGSAVEEKDTLRTGPASNLQVRFIDEAIVSMKPQSQLRVDEYQFTGQVDGKEKGFFSLLKGGFRTVTGFIGRVSRDNYGVRTSTATVGIRGTHFALMDCAGGSCANPDGSAAKDGLYGAVTDGRIAAITNVGEFQFGAGEAFHALDINSPVQKLLVAPDFVADRLEGRKQGGTKKAEAGDEKAEAKSGGVKDESRPNIFVGQGPVTPDIIVLPPPPPTPGVVPITDLPMLLSLDGFPVPIGFFDAYLTGTASITGTGSAERLNGFNLSASFPEFSFAMKGAEGPGGTDMPGYLSTIDAHWGRWIDGSLTFAYSDSYGSESGSGVPGTGIHYLYARDVTPVATLAAKTGSFDFSNIGGTTPTNSLGQTASNYSFGTLTVDFTSQRARLASMDMVFPSNTYSFGPMHMHVFAEPAYGVAGIEGFLSNEGSCNTCSGGTVDEVNIFGGFGGADASHAGLSIGTWDASAGSTSSVQLFSKTGAGSPLFSIAGIIAYGNTGAIGISDALADADPYAYLGLTDGNLTSYSVYGGSYEGNLASGTVNDTGLLGPINGGYGRWNGGAVTSRGGGSVAPPPFPGTGVHYVYGDLTPASVILGMTGTNVIYGSLAGTTPTDGAGATGSWGGGSIAVNFLAQSATMSANWTVVGASPATYTLTNSPLNFSYGNGVGLDASLYNHATTSCSGACTGTIGAVELRGKFLGATGDHIGMGIATHHAGSLTSATARVFTSNPPL